MRLGVVTGLVAEAAIARPLGDVLAGGGMPAGAEAAAEALVARGATALLSFGLAGGLDPALGAGDVVVPRAVIEHGTRYPTGETLAHCLGGWSAGDLVATDGVVVSVADKAALFRDTGAVAVDLESGAVARVAARHAMPFAVLRAICDPAWRALPPAALAALNSRGAIAAGNIIASLLREPGQTPALIRLGRDAAMARRALVGRVHRVVDQGGFVVL